ncbi:MAG TPA: hypothetical protein VKA10_04070, partial [Prolixibacteraceae bacterium]|nr:hypothetical protein [Prolixibacteraceae bacterium]
MSDKLIFDRIKTSRNIAYKFIFTVLLAMLAFSAVAKTYYVSNSGNDANLGTSPGNAWKTLDKVNSFTPSPGDQILFRRGDEWVGTLIVNASGTEVNPIVYGAYGDGSKPKIYGSEKITGWELHEGNIYKATVNAQSINQVFIDGERLSSARHPDSGYLNITSVNDPTSFTSSQLSSETDYNGAVAFIRVKEWAISTLNVTNSGGRTLSIDSKPVYELKVGGGFVLFNKLEFLNKPGEWFF